MRTLNFIRERVLRKIQLFLIITSMTYLLVGCTTECPRCKGRGVVSQEYVAKTECSSCDGYGKTVCDYSFTNQGIGSWSTYVCNNGYYKFVKGGGFASTGGLAGNKCTKCNGKGYLYCSNCNGKGYHEETKTKQVDCPKCDGSGKVSKF